MAQQNVKSSRPNAIAIQKYLKGLHYPVTKSDLVQRAKENSAPEDVMKTLDMLPDQEFPRVSDVSKAIGQLKR